MQLPSQIALQEEETQDNPMAKRTREDRGGNRCCHLGT